MGKVMVFDHPLIQHKVGIIRDEKTDRKVFRELVSEIAMLMAYEVTRDLKVVDKKIKTPICEAVVKEVEDKDISIVPILRAGLGMVEGMLSLLPKARVGHVGMYRDHTTLEPVPYYSKLPSGLDKSLTIVLDPMLATGGSVINAIQYLKDEGATNIKFMCLIASTYGIEKVQEAHSDVEIYAAAVDDTLNEKAYIVPGLGDAGDRLFGTM